MADTIKLTVRGKETNLPLHLTDYPQEAHANPADPRDAALIRSGETEYPEVPKDFDPDEKLRQVKANS